MAPVTLEARSRALYGKHARFLRRAGITPGNLYGAGMPSMALQVETKKLVSILATTSRNTPIELHLLGESEPRSAFVWGIQRDPLTEQILHVDFYHVEATRTMRASVPVVLDNVIPDLERFDKRVAYLLDAVEVESLPADLPTEIRVDASGLKELDDQVLVKDLVVGERVHIVTAAETVVAKVLPYVEAVLEEEAPAEAVPAEGAVEGEGEGEEKAEAGEAAEEGEEKE